VLIESEGERIISVRGDPEHPAIFGRRCRSQLAVGGCLGESGQIRILVKHKDARRQQRVY
jgi:hypothetical protein